MNRNKQEYFTGCLLGGAVGDALGWPIELHLCPACRCIFRERYR